MRKGYKLSDERRDQLYERGYRGFGYRGIGDEQGTERDVYGVRQQSSGPPGLSVTHYTPTGIEACPSAGVGCDRERHHLQYRDKNGETVAYASTSAGTRSGKPKVNGMYADRSRGITHALAVGHIAHHLSKIGVEPDSSLSSHSQRLVSHGLDLEEGGGASKLKDYLARRANRVRKGYELTPERRQRAFDHTGGHHFNVRAWDNDDDDSDDWAQNELRRIPQGRPGLSIHRNKVGTGGGFSAARWAPWSGEHSIVYRDSGGHAVTAAQLQTHVDGEKLARPKVTQMVSDRSRGALHAIGTAHVSRVLQRFNPGSGSLTVHSQRLVAHGLDLGQEKTNRLADYLKRRQRR